MGQDLLKTITRLENDAIGNCRKRIEAAAQRAKGNAGNGDVAHGPERSESQRGVTSILKERHGL